MLSWKTNTKLQVNLYAFWTRIKGWDQQQFMHFKWKTKIAHKRVLKSTSSLGCCFHYSPLRKPQSRRLSCCTSWATQPLSPGLCWFFPSNWEGIKIPRFCFTHNCMTPWKPYSLLQNRFKHHEEFDIQVLALLSSTRWRWKLVQVLLVLFLKEILEKLKELLETEPVCGGDWWGQQHVRSGGSLL